MPVSDLSFKKDPSGCLPVSYAKKIIALKGGYGCTTERTTCAQ
jgi:hypothetical protein